MSPSCWQGLGSKSSLEETGGRTSRSKAESTGTETDVSAGSREGMEDEAQQDGHPYGNRALCTRLVVKVYGLTCSGFSSSLKP